MSEEHYDIITDLRNVIARQASLVRWLLFGMGGMIAGAFAIGVWVATMQVKTLELTSSMLVANQDIKIHTAQIAQHETKIQLLNQKAKIPD